MNELGTFLFSKYEFLYLFFPGGFEPANEKEGDLGGLRSYRQWI